MRDLRARGAVPGPIDGTRRCAEKRHVMGRGRAPHLLGHLRLACVSLEHHPFETLHPHAPWKLCSEQVELMLCVVHHVEVQAGEEELLPHVPHLGGTEHLVYLLPSYELVRTENHEVWAPHLPRTQRRQQLALCPSITRVGLKLPLQRFDICRCKRRCHFAATQTDRQTVRKILHRSSHFQRERLEASLCPTKSAEKERDGSLLRWRRWIESATPAAVGSCRSLRLSHCRTGTKSSPRASQPEKRIKPHIP